MRDLKTHLRDRLLPVAGRMRRSGWTSVDDVVLIFQPDHLGDILLSQPAVRSLRDRHPDSQLVAVVGPWSFEIASIAWPVDEILTLPFPGFSRAARTSPIGPYRLLKAESRRLATFRARSAYVLRPDAWWAAWLASLVAPEVITSNDPRTASFATHPVEIDADDHAAIRALRIASAGDQAENPTPGESQVTLRTETQAVEEAERLLREHNVAGRYLIIHPGSGATVKEWPANRWCAVAEQLASDGHQVVLTGSRSEDDLCAAIAAGVPACRSVAGKTSVPVLAELLSRADIVLGPDSGPLHLAVAAGTPTIHLFGPSDPRRYGPWGDSGRHQVVSAGWRCPRCGDLSQSRESGCGCMLAIQVADVVAAARSLIYRHAS